DAAPRDALSALCRLADQHQVFVEVMDVALDGEVRRPADHVADGDEQLEQDAGGVRLGVRLEGANILTGQPVVCFLGQRLRPGIAIFYRRMVRRWASG